MTMTRHLRTRVLRLRLKRGEGARETPAFSICPQVVEKEGYMGTDGPWLTGRVSDTTVRGPSFEARGSSWVRLLFQPFRSICSSSEITEV